MQVRICPKCKAENKFSSASCCKCYASLEGAEVKEAPDPVVPEIVQKPPPHHPRSAEIPPPAAPPSAGPNDYGPPPLYAEPPGLSKRPVKSGPGAGFIVFLVIVLAAAGFAGWWFLMKPKTPEQVVTAFIAAGEKGDPAEIKLYLCAGSKDVMDRPDAGNMFKSGSKIKVGETTFEGDSTAVVQITPDQSSSDPMMKELGTLPLVLVKEQGKWLIDLQESEKRMMAKIMPLLIKKGFRMPQKP